MLKSALQFYLNFRSDIKAYGFKVNPYDPCVANADLYGHQITMIWHVDDLKVSHKDPFEINKFPHYLSLQNGKKLTVKLGKVHEYLGMNLDYSRKGAVKVSMIKYLQKVEDEFPMEITGTAKSTACKHLFHVRDNDYPRKHYLDATRAM